MRKSARTSYLIKWGAHPCASNTPDIHKLGILSGKLPKYKIRVRPRAEYCREPAVVSFDTAGCLECGSRANSALKPGSMVVARTWWLIFSPAHRACASIDGSYRIHCELVFHIELFLRFIRLRSSQVRSWLSPSSAGSKAGVVAGSTLLRTENRAGGSISSWLSVQE
jgi:hypothetical protein